MMAWRWAVLLLVIVATVVSWPIANQLEFDQRIESLYSEDDPHLEAFKEGKRLFGGDEFAIVAWNEPNLLDEDGSVSVESAERLNDLAQKIAKVPGVQPESIQHIAKALAFPYQRTEVTKLLEGVLIGADHQTVSIVVRLQPELETEEDESPSSVGPNARLAAVPRGETIAMIRKLAASHDPPAFVVGEPIQIHDMFRYVEEDGRVLFQVSLVLLSFVLFILLRSLRWVLLPLIVVVLTIRWTATLLVLTDAKLSMVSSMMNSLVMIIGVATTTHLAVRFRDKRTAGISRDQALRETLQELLPPIVWTCGTTAVGFAALLSSQITPVRSFGLMMSVATFLVFVVTAVITPACMSTFRRSTDSQALKSPAARRLIDMLIGDPVPAPAERQLTRVLTGISGWVERNPLMVLLGAVAVLGVAFWGLFRLEIETDFSKNFRDSSSLSKSLKFVESRLGGAGTWEINFPAPAELDDTYLDQVRSLADRLRRELLAKPGEPTEGKLTKVIALTDGLDLVPKSIQLGFASRDLTIPQRISILGKLQSDFVVSLYNQSECRMRVVLRSSEQQQSDRKQGLIDRVQQITRESLQLQELEDSSGSNRPIEAAGLFVLLTFLIESLLRDQIVSFLIAVIGIATMMTIAFRSWRTGLVCMIPNLFPIALVIGTMGILGLSINIATAMIASVSMGLTVDNSIHYLTEYRRARAAGASRHDAVTQTQATVGRALVFANVALVAGFIVLTLSHFIPLVYFGFLVSVAMLGGLGGNLFLLPLLLTWREGVLHDSIVIEGEAETHTPDSSE
jgi:predicted RND superfamily exporter protein